MNSKRETASKNVNASQEMKQYYSRYGGAELRTGDLVSRIYDHGFSIKTMPSVKRPSNQVTESKALSAKLYPIKKRHGQEPMLFLPQSTVFHSAMNQQQQAHEGEFMMMPVAEKNEELMMEGEEDVQRNQNIGSKPMPTVSNFYLSNRSQQNFFALGSRLNPERLEQSMNRTSSMPHFGQGMVPGSAGGASQLAQSKAFGATHAGKFGSTTNMNFFSKGAGSHQDRETLATPFSEQEMRRTKFLVDKISGKFNVDKRYATGNNFYSSGQQSELQKEMNSPEGAHGGSAYGNGAAQLNSPGGAQGVVGIEEIAPLRPTSKLDKYIDLILKNVTNVDEFIYLQRNPEDPDDPYNLSVINYSKIKDEGIGEYYTISKKGLCHYVNGKPVEFIVLAYWLKERDTYDRIKRLKFFKKFRKWKTLRTWKKNVIRKKISNCTEALEEKLFILNDILRETLLAHRAECCDMEKLRFVEVSQAQYGILAEIPTLETFKATQDKKRKQIRAKIEEISSNCRENVRKGFKKSLDELRKSQHAAAFEEDFAKRNDNQNFFRLKESAYENLGFPENMSYERRSELRKECSKFLRFSYLIDFLAMESLRNIYLLSVHELIHELEVMVNIKENVILKDKTARIVTKSREPLFNVNIEFHFDPVNESHLQVVDLKEYVPPPIGKSEIQDFNIIYHVKLRQPKIKSEETNNDPKGKGIYLTKKNAPFF